MPHQPIDVPPLPDRLATALALLHAQARPGELAGMARFGIVGEHRLGLSMPAMRQIARTLGRDHELALELWATGIPDARIVAGMVADPARLTSRQLDAWAQGFAYGARCAQYGNIPAFRHGGVLQKKAALPDYPAGALR